ncbi:MAG: response regulator transcription factor [Chloroflexi bacterium]|nr:response regulator transcription factor [Chloroflexota bacterium]
MARILVVDDDEYILDIVERTLRQHGHTVTLARDGREALRLLERRPLDLVILDIIMPRLSGLEVCRHIRRTPNLADMPILFLTARGQVEDKLEGFEAGADDYLAKPFDLNELVLRVRALLRYTGAAASIGVLQIGGMCLDPETGKVQVAGRAVHVTPVEFELLYYLASRAGQTHSTEELLQQVWGYPPGTGSPSLVRMHVLNLRRKIEADPQHPVYLRTVPRHGYLFQPPD